jgi:hypothetical protein
MDRFERDPEGETLKWLRAAIPTVDKVSIAAGILLDTTPTVLLACDELYPSEKSTLAYAYNNLMALYGRGQTRVIDAHRFLHQNPTQTTFNGACDKHAAKKLVELARGGGRRQPEFFTYANAYTLACDTSTAWIPRDPYLRAITRMFEASVQYSVTLRRCEVIARRGAQLVVVDREFASVGQYDRAVSAWRDELAARTRAVGARRLGCVACCPCVATEVLSLYPGAPFVLPYGEKTPKVEREELPRERFITTSTFESVSLAERQNAILWFFAGTCGPLACFFSVVEALRGGTTDDAIGLVQEVALRNWLRYRETPDEARRQQQNAVAPSLRAGRLYSPTDAMMITDCTTTSSSSSSPLSSSAARRIARSAPRAPGTTPTQSPPPPAPPSPRHPSASAPR